MTAVDLSRHTDHRADLDAALTGYFAHQQHRAADLGVASIEMWRRLADATTGGKRVRPLVLLRAHEALGGRRREAALSAAVAIELLHTAFVIHDDIIDRDTRRRGTENFIGVHASHAAAQGLDADRADRWAQSMGLLGGDLLLTAALRVVGGLDLPVEQRVGMLGVFEDAIGRAVVGERDDLAFSLGLEVPSEAQIRLMMERKTASYTFAAPLRSAALLADARAETAAQLGVIGNALGAIFQIRDDLLGVFGDSAVTGKSAASDLREGKVTLLIAYAQRSDQWAKVSDLWGRPDLSAGDVDVLRSVIERSGAKARLERELEREVARLRSLVAATPLPRTLAADLIVEADRAWGRAA